MKKLTIQQLARKVTKTGSHFFDQDSMRHFGDTFENFVISGPILVETTTDLNVRCWKLSRKKPSQDLVMEGVIYTGSYYFCCKTFTRIYPGQYSATAARVRREAEYIREHCPESTEVPQNGSLDPEGTIYRDHE